jgi:hypothetical protein
MRSAVGISRLQAGEDVNSSSKREMDISLVLGATGVRPIGQFV